jgi:hypothetical protein
MNEDLILKKFEDYRKQGLSIREAIERLRVDFMSLLQGKLDEETPEQDHLKESIERMMDSLMDRFSKK